MGLFWTFCLSLKSQYDMTGPKVYGKKGGIVEQLRLWQNPQASATEYKVHYNVLIQTPLRLRGR